MSVNVPNSPTGRSCGHSQITGDDAGLAGVKYLVQSELSSDVRGFRKVLE